LQVVQVNKQNIMKSALKIIDEIVEVKSIK
jgi:hypothetical protein